MVGIQKGHQVQLCSYYTPKTVARLRKLSQKTRITLAVYLREAADDLLMKYAAALEGTEEEEGLQRQA